MKYTPEIHNRLRELIGGRLLDDAIEISCLLDEIERLQAENRWRKYPDEKPEKEGIYLTITPEKNEEDEIIRMAWDGENWSEVEYDDFYGHVRFGVSLWRPLPAIESEE